MYDKAPGVAEATGKRMRIRGRSGQQVLSFIMCVRKFEIGRLCQGMIGWLESLCLVGN